MKKNLFYLILAAVLIGFWWYQYKIPATISFPSVSAEYPEGNFGMLVDLVQEGPVIFHFYATWCLPCMHELPAIHAFADSITSGKTIVYLITDDPWEKIHPIQEKMGKSIQIIRIPSIKKLGIHSIPVTYFLDRQLVSQKEQLGVCPWKDPLFIKEIQRIISF